MSDEPTEDIKAYACDVRDLLGLQAWEIVIKMADTIEGDPSIGGDCSSNEPYRIAHIRLRRDSTPEEHREHVMHEMLHVVMSPYDVASSYVKDMLPFKRHSLAERIMADASERVVSALAKALVKGIKPPPVEEAA